MKIGGIKTIEWHLSPWRKSTLLHDRVIKPSKAKVHVYSDFVLCLRKMHPHPAAMEKLKEELEYFLGSAYHKELYGIERRGI